MTNEEAIKIIKDYMTNDANHTLKIWFEALNLAIKALEETGTNTIDALKIVKRS